MSPSRASCSTAAGSTTALSVLNNSDDLRLRMMPESDARRRPAGAPAPVCRGNCRRRRQRRRRRWRRSPLLPSRPRARRRPLRPPLPRPPHAPGLRAKATRSPRSAPRQTASIRSAATLLFTARRKPMMNHLREWGFSVGLLLLWAIAAAFTLRSLIGMRQRSRRRRFLRNRRRSWRGRSRPRSVPPVPRPDRAGIRSAALSRPWGRTSSAARSASRG